MYTAEPDGDGTYEAVVYGDVDAPTPGRKFGSDATVTPTGDFEYQLNADGALAIDTSTAAVQERIALTGVTRTAGTETFNLPDPNPSSATVINVPGSHHGVSGTYNCTPSAPADGCTASVAAEGFTLAGGTWTFTPGDANAQIMETTPDTAYASYGWWLHKSEDGKTYTVSAFAANRGTVAAALNVGALQGTATYMGGAAGKYALASSTGGTNDAGHFTADATLLADFGEDMITGTIDNFTGADGEARDGWSVELMEQGVGDTGIILGADGTGDARMTKWTIDGSTADAAGSWQGNLWENGDDNVPSIATGTFHSVYGTAGRIVGAFGVDKQ